MSRLRRSPHRSAHNRLPIAAKEAERDGNRPLLPYLKGVLGSLNPTERVIAECVLADPDAITTSAVAEIHKRCGASVGSIVAFYRRLGFRTFTNFKIALARDLTQSGMLGMPGLLSREEHGGANLFAKVFHLHAQSLKDTLQLNPPAALERAARALESARRIELFSIGLSYPVAYTAYGKFLLLGLPAGTEADAHVQLIKATQLKSGDVAFAVSCSGTTPETVQCLEAAKAHGATTLSITNAVRSPITRCSDVSLYATPSEINYFQAPLASRITQLALIDALFVSLAIKHKNKTAARLQESAEELAKRRE